MHRSIYISKNNGINIVCLLVKLYFGQVLPLLISKQFDISRVGHPAVHCSQTVSVHKRRYNYLGRQTKFCSGSGQPERKGKNRSQSLKGKHRQFYIKVHLCVLWSFATYVKGSSMEGAGSCANSDKLMSLEATFFWGGGGEGARLRLQV